MEKWEIKKEWYGGGGKYVKLGRKSGGWRMGGGGGEGI